MKNHHHTHGWNQLAASTGLALACGLLTLNARADVEVARRWAATAPNINGTATAAGWGTATVTTIPEGAAEAIRLALLPDDGPTGTYSDRKGIVPW